MDTRVAVVHTKVGIQYNIDILQIPKFSSYTRNIIMTIVESINNNTIKKMYVLYN